MSPLQAGESRQWLRLNRSYRAVTSFGAATLATFLLTHVGTRDGGPSDRGLLRRLCLLATTICCVLVLTPANTRLSTGRSRGNRSCSGICPSVQPAKAKAMAADRGVNRPEAYC